KVGDVRWRFPRDYSGVFVLFLQVIDEEGQVLAENGSVHSAAPDPPFAPLLDATATRIQAERTGTRIQVENRGSAFALFVEIGATDPAAVRVGDSHFLLPPGEAREVALDGNAEVLRVTAWNQEAVVEV